MRDYVNKLSHHTANTCVICCHSSSRSHRASLQTKNLFEDLLLIIGDLRARMIGLLDT
jgi:hypothetical protein